MFTPEPTNEPLREATDETEYPGIGDYALIGDCRSAALVSKQGSIDWLCLPHFSSPSVFAALVDRRRGGRFAVRPREVFRSRQRYLDATAVAVTEFETAGGRARVTDFMPLGDEGKTLRPQREIVRVIEGLAGTVELALVFEPRPDYARRRPALTRNGKGTIVWRDGNEVMILRAEAELTLSRQRDSARGVLSMAAGSRSTMTIAYCQRDVGILRPPAEAAAELEDTCRWWRQWSHGCAAGLPFEGPVVRSAVTLKLLCSGLTGAVLAAPTTSLPEVVGGIRNWDYRFCWLRDASLTLRALIDLGLTQESQLFLHWLLYSTSLTRPRLSVLYDLFGENRLPERVLDHLEGYRGSAPVRIGNGAASQLQLDVYGAVALAARLFVRRGGELEPAERRMLSRLGRQVMKSWREPDHGIWEIRGRKDHYTYSKLMCWAALDAVLELCDTSDVRGDRDALRRERDAIRNVIETRAFDHETGSYVATLDGDAPDASLLVIARTGFHDPLDERMLGTWRTIDSRLGNGALLHRYPPTSDGMPGTEGAMVLSSFWAVDYLARAGRGEEALERFRTLLGYANEAGLLAEQVDVQSGAALGNFPQAFSHLALITAAISLERFGAH